MTATEQSLGLMLNITDVCVYIRNSLKINFTELKH